MTTELTKAAQQAHTPEHIAGVDHAHELLRRMGYHRDGDWFIHANRRGAEAIHTSTISTIVNAGQLVITQRPAAQTERDTGPRLLREVFALCEDTVDKMTAESTEFSRGRAFEAKGIARAIGTWFQDEFCGRSHMGEPVIVPAPQQATPEPVGELFGWLFQHEETGLVQVVDSQQVEWGFEANNPRWQKIRPVYTRTDPVETEPVGEQATVPRDAYDALERERDYWRTRARAMIDHAEGTCWYWMGDGSDHPESMVNSLPVVIRADQLRDLLARPAPGVPEGFALVPVEPTAEMMEAMPSLPAIGAPGDMELKAKGWSLKAIQNRHRWLAALAAAQAKGGQA